MTYTVSSRTLNSTVPYHIVFSLCSGLMNFFCGFEVCFCTIVQFRDIFSAPGVHIVAFKADECGM